MSPFVTPIVLLIASNVFMTFAWYGHLKHLERRAWWVAALLSWGIALFEYLLQVPANRIGFTVMTLPLRPGPDWEQTPDYARSLTVAVRREPRAVAIEPPQAASLPVPRNGCPVRKMCSSPVRGERIIWPQDKLSSECTFF